MRLLGFALVTAWAIAWWSTPHGEPAPATRMAGALAITGGDRAAVAWLEMPMGADRHLTAWLHVAIVDEHDHVIPVIDRIDDGEIQLADAGDGRFVLATAHLDPAGNQTAQPHAAYDLEVFDEHGIVRHDTFPGGTYMHPPFRWQLYAAGEHVAIRETISGENEIHYLPEGSTLDIRSALVGAAEAHLLRYEMQPREHKVVLEDGSAITVAPPDCVGQEPYSPSSWKPTAGAVFPPRASADVVSVVPLRGGFARLSRTNQRGCVDGLRDGKPFAYKNLDLRLFTAARLALERNGSDDQRLVISDENQGLALARRLVLPARSGDPVLFETTAFASEDRGDGVHYRLFGHAGKRGLPALGTRIRAGENAVVFERFSRSATSGETILAEGPLASARLHGQLQRVSSVALGPPRALRPDRRPLLRRLAVLPLGVLAFAVATSGLLLRRLRRLSPTAGHEPLRAGPAAVEGTLSRDADAPEGSLRIRRGRGPLRLFIEGADVLRASDVRSRREPRGDAVDVASGASVFATGIAEPGSAFRAEDTLHARRGDVVVVGCSLAEARARVRSRLVASATLLAAGSLLVASLVIGG